MITLTDVLMNLGLKIRGLAKVAAPYPSDIQLAIAGEVYVSHYEADCPPLATKESKVEQGLTGLGLGLWTSSGFPVIDLSHKLGASLLVSAITPEVLESLRAPWRAFLINVPQGLIMACDPEDRSPIPVVKILCFHAPQTGAGPWNYLAYCKGPGSPENFYTLFRHGCPIELLCTPAKEIEGGVTIPNTGTFELSELDVTAQELVGRLIITTIALAAVHKLSPTGPGHVRHGQTKLGEAPPAVACLYQFGKDVVIETDFRSRVKAFQGLGDQTSTLASKLVVQTVVMGHFKRQHHGLGNNFVKTIWIKPYIRGPEGMPMVVRPHELRGQEDRKTERGNQ